MTTEEIKAAILFGGTLGGAAGKIKYDPTVSGLDADTVQEAIDELAEAVSGKADKPLIKTVMDAGLKAGLTAEQAYAKAMAAVAKHTIMRTMKMATMALARFTRMARSP